MWFDEIMEDCKQSLVTANKYKRIFIPIFLKLALTIGVFAYVFISIFAAVFKYQYMLEYMFMDPSVFMEVLPGILINLAVLYLLTLIGFSLLDVGSLNLLKAAFHDQKPKFKDFTDGIKNYFVKVLLGKLLIHLIIVVFSPILIALYLLYTLLVGTLTAGWGLLFLGVFISVYFGTWITITVVEGCSPIAAIGKGIKLGRKYFKGLFVILLAAALISSYSTVIFGVLAAVVAGWFISGVIITYFNLIVMQIYYRNKENI